MRKLWLPEDRLPEIQQNRQFPKIQQIETFQISVQETFQKSRKETFQILQKGNFPNSANKIRFSSNLNFFFRLFFTLFFHKQSPNSKIAANFNFTRSRTCNYHARSQQHKDNNLSMLNIKLDKKREKNKIFRRRERRRFRIFQNNKN